MLKTLKLTPLLVAQLERVERAAGLYPNEDDGYAPLEREQLLLAEIVFEEVQRQQVQQHRIRRLPARAVNPSVVEVTLRPKRRQG